LSTPGYGTVQVQRKVVLSRRHQAGTAYLEEPAFPPCEGLLERGQKNHTEDVAESHPEVVSLPLHLKEVKEDVYRGCTSEEAKQNVKGLNEGPIVRIQLGWGSVHLCQQLSLEPRKREAHADALKSHLIKIEKGDPTVGPFVSA